MTIIQPSVIFGRGDAFFNRFAALLRMAPFLPLACPEARMQPVWAGDVAALVDVIRQQDVPAVFVGTSASRGVQDLAATLADEVGGEVRVLPLLTGSLAPAGQPGDTYLGLIRFDVDQIVAGLAE